MVKEELYINGESVELLGSLNPNLTFNIADIAKPDTRKADHSKTIELPASKKINKIFEHIFDLNTDLQSFNPNLKTDVVYLVNGEIQIDGYLQLKSIKNKDGEIIYNCIIIGRIGNFIAELQNNELTDLDLSSLDHTYTKANQSATWNYPLTTDYVYPMINYNVNYGTLSDITELWRVTDLYPAVKAKKYIDAIFSSVDYSYTSTFLTSDFFNTLIIPFSAKEFNLDETAINNRIIEANTPVIAGTNNDYVNPVLYTDEYSLDSNFLTFSNEVRDAGNIYDNSTGVLEVQAGKAGFYNLSTMVKIQGEFTAPSSAPAGGGDWELSAYVHGNIQFRLLNPNGSLKFNIDSVPFGVTKEGATVAAGGTIITDLNPTTPGDNHIYALVRGYDPTYWIWNGSIHNTNSICNEFRLNVNDVYLSEGEKLKVVLNYAVRRNNENLTNQGEWFDSAGNYTSGGPYKLNMLTGYLKTECVNREITEGSNIPINSTIPRKIKQKDFIMSLVKMFNLYMQPDPNNERNLIIEPRDDFYSNDIVDWSNKLDISKDIESKPMGALNFKEYLYTYKQDKDYYNKQYFDTWEEIYGQDDFTLVNQFVNGQHKTEVIFSPTPSVGQYWYDRVLPTIIKFDDNNGVQKTESNIRILQWGGMKATGQQWSHIDGAGNSTNYSTYPYSGMYDDPYSPTTLLDFGLSNEVYYSNVFDKVITFSNNTLFNKYYSKFLQEITDNNSKIVSAYFYLSPSDIKQLSFSKQYYFENQYFRLNKIENYNPSNPITKCEFLKIKLTDVFVPTTGVSHGGPKDIGGNSIPRFSIGQSSLRNGNVVNNLNQKAIGSNNYISSNARGVNIIGDSNKIFSNTKNIQISGNNNTVESGLENVQLINTSNQTVTNSDTTYVNGTITGPGASQTITANTVASENVQIYFCDSSAASFYVEFRGTNLVTGKTFTFKKVNSANQVTIDATYSNHTIDGQGTYVLNSHYKYVTIQFDGQNFLITSNN